MLTRDNTYWYIEKKFTGNGKIHAIAHVRGLLLKNDRRLALDNFISHINENPETCFIEPVRLWKDILEVKKKTAH